MQRLNKSNGSQAQWAEITYAPGGVPEVSTSWLAEHLDEVRLVDVRGFSEVVGDLGYIEGMEHAPLDKLASSAQQWNPDDKIVVLCRSGGRSGRAAMMLLNAGFTRVASLAGGMLKWVEENRPIRRDL